MPNGSAGSAGKPPKGLHNLPKGLVGGGMPGEEKGCSIDPRHVLAKPPHAANTGGCKHSHCV